MDSIQQREFNGFSGFDVDGLKDNINKNAIPGPPEPGTVLSWL